ncbi:F-box protein At1g11270-like [Syzygium oleosum]|uniref:F-box protein At1g11270-like n=1 Tax=Syzygium oleosum TaxID=219896 RepID=UPI0011D2A8E5|nr:F-box protein At1g11270-like [Syzygium oleosum]
METSEKRSSSSDESIPYLSPEIISEILCKLPIDSVLRCRCVCKAWCYLTKSATFIEQLLSSNDYREPWLILEPFCADDDSTQRFLLVDIEGRRVRQIHIDPLKGLSAMGTCRGLLCVGSYSALDPIFVCNPITREYRRLPTSGETIMGGHQVGLGFDPSTEKYKALRTYVNIEGRRCFEVTTLGASSWRRLDVPEGWQAYFVYEPVFWNGAIHWKASGNERDVIISFDVCHEKFRIISFTQDVGQFDLGVRHDNNGQSLLPPQGFVPDGNAPLATTIEANELELLGFRGCLTIVEHDNEWMREWEVTGDKFEDLSICFWDFHDMTWCGIPT